MADRGGGAGLAPKAPLRLLAHCFWADHLERDRPIQPVVVSGVDDAHSTLAQLADDAVPADPVGH